MGAASAKYARTSRDKPTWGSTVGSATVGTSIVGGMIVFVGASVGTGSGAAVGPGTPVGSGADVVEGRLGLCGHPFKLEQPCDTPNAQAAGFLPIFCNLVSEVHPV